MSKYLSLLAILCTFSAAHAAEPQNPLTVRNDFGVHKPQENLKIEVYATTKGELQYSIEIKDGDTNRGFGSNFHDGNSMSFYWDAEQKRVWKKSDTLIGYFDYSKNHNQSDTYPLDMAQKLNAPLAVLDSSKCFTLSPTLGKVYLTDDVYIDIYADTRGVVWRTSYIRGKQRESSELECKEPGTECIYYWDNDANTLWALTKINVYQTVYRDNGMSFSSYSLSDQEVQKAPAPVKVIVEKMLEKE